MKIFWWSLLALVVIVPAVLYFLQKQRQQKAQRDGVAVYATRRFGCAGEGVRETFGDSEDCDVAAGTGR